ncbi:MAG: FHA domain-containing protein [Acidimicrobiales bacterium]|nr:FHA domain-containing protein [Acidimicrobiales bacterium]
MQLTSDFSYFPGKATAFVTDSCALLLAGEVAGDKSSNIWDTLSGSALEILGAVGSDNLLTMPDFALVVKDHETLRCFVKGAFIVDVSGSELKSYSGENYISWHELLIEDYDFVLIKTSQYSAGDAFLPVASGVVLVECVKLTKVHHLDNTDIADEKSEVKPNSPISAEVLSEPENLSTSHPVPSSQPNVSERNTQEENEEISNGEETLVSWQSDETSPESDEEISDENKPALNSSSDEEPNEKSYDYLFGATTHTNVEQAAVRQDVQLDEDVQEDPPVEVHVEMPIIVKDPPPAPVLEVPGLIDFVPSVTSESENFKDANNNSMQPNQVNVPKAPVSLPPPPVSHISSPPPSGFLPPPPPPPSGFLPPPQAVPYPLAPPINLDSEVDESTVARPAKPANVGFEGNSLVQVQATFCPENHPNPPRSTKCRTCGNDIDSTEITTIPRPNLGNLRFSNGAIVSLDRDILIGRNPKVDGVESTKVPQIVALTSPDQNISRNHAVVIIEGWHVTVKDLNSTNGTEVTLPDEQPQRLRPNEPVQIIPGSKITIADEVSALYET